MNKIKRLIEMETKKLIKAAKGKDRLLIQFLVSTGLRLKKENEEHSDNYFLVIIL